MLTNHWEEQGAKNEAQIMALRLLHRRIGDIPEIVEGSILRLPLAKLEELPDVVFDFTKLSDLETGLTTNASDGVRTAD